MAPMNQLQRELDVLPAPLLLQLPEPCFVHVRVPGVTHDVLLATAQGAPAPLDHHTLVFDTNELEALIIGVAYERFGAEDFLNACQQKQQNPAWRLTRSKALDGSQINECTNQAHLHVGSLLNYLHAAAQAIIPYDEMPRLATAA